MGRGGRWGVASQLQQQASASIWHQSAASSSLPAPGGRPSVQTGVTLPAQWPTQAAWHTVYTRWWSRRDQLLMTSRSSIVLLSDRGKPYFRYLPQHIGHMWRSQLCGPLHNQNNHVHRSTIQINTPPHCFCVCLSAWTAKLLLIRITGFGPALTNRTPVLQKIELYNPTCRAAKLKSFTVICM